MGECCTETGEVRSHSLTGHSKQKRAPEAVAAAAVAGRDYSQVLISFSAYCRATLLCSSSSNTSGGGSHLHAAEGYFIYADCNAVNDKAVQRIAELFQNDPLSIQ